MADLTLPPLPYSKNALEGFLSEQTLTFHHDKHLNAYVETTNKLKKGTSFENESLETIIKKAQPGPLFNNAAQVFNHTFYFKCLCAEKKQPSANLMALIEKSFNSYDDFIDLFKASAVGNFGSGWTWLCASNGALEIVNTSNAANPLTMGKTPILCVDVWEHAYYLDYQNRRADYLKDFVEHIDWDFVESNLPQ